MQSKFIRAIIICIFILSIILSVFNIGCGASSYKIDIDEISHKCISSFNKGGIKYSYYDILVTLSNSGIADSDNMTIELIDSSGSYIKYFNVESESSKIVIYKDHPLSSIETNNIEIKFYPTSKDVLINSNNSGTKAYNIKDSNSNESTPGFEFITFIITLSMLIYIKKRKY